METMAPVVATVGSEALSVFKVITHPALPTTLPEPSGCA